MTTVYLNQFHVVQPKNRAPQGDLLQWMTKCHQRAESFAPQDASVEKRASPEMIEKLFRRYGVGPSQIGTRYSECGDAMAPDFENNLIYKPDSMHPHGADIAVRARFFSERGDEVFQKFYDVQQTRPRPDHLIHVTCTGYISPSAAQKIVTEKNWQHPTDITHAYHMGCYAAMPAVRLAKSLVLAESPENEKFRTDIVHTEMCGLHMNPMVHTPEQIVVQTLFADGHIKYSASTQKNSNGKNLKIIAIHEKIIPGSDQDMSWMPSPWGMQMNLSREVPAKIKIELKNFSNELFKKAGLALDQALKSVFAIHPGGPKIIDSVREALELNENQIAESRKILFERGNMSSATLPHVWNEILDHGYPAGTKIVSYAFGPGLTLFGSVFEVCE